MKKILVRLALILLGLAILSAVGTAAVFSLANETNGTLSSGGETRKYLLYVPESYNPQIPTSLVISIHGYAEWPAHQRDISGWNELADRHGFIVVYPSGTGFPLHWITQGEGTASETDPMQDVTFISDLIDEIETEYNIDERRIYANGLSNGGGMSYLLACALSERIAAIGSVAGAYLLPEEACNPQRPVPVIAFHGTADEIVPYGGGPSDAFDIPFPVVPEWIEGWATHNRCEERMEIPATGEVSGIRYTKCRQDADVVFYTIDGGGHSWPGGEPLPEIIVGSTTDDIEATETMWRFFEEHPLPG